MPPDFDRRLRSKYYHFITRARHREQLKNRELSRRFRECRAIIDEAMKGNR